MAMVEILKMNKIPLLLKIMIGGIPILLILIYLLVLNNKGTLNRKSFYRQGFSSVVVKKDVFQGRSFEFLLKNGLIVHFGLSSVNMIEVGDSIRKDANTYIYDVYRKDENGEYKFWVTYNFEQTL
jgi:hypothetical protein